MLGLLFLVACAVVPDGGDVEGDSGSALGWILGMDEPPELTELAFYSWLLAACTAGLAVLWFFVDRAAARRAPVDGTTMRD